MEAELLNKPRLADEALSTTLKRQLGVDTLTAEIQVENMLPVGVYHLLTRWREGTRVVAEKRSAFEVMPADPHGLSAPLASGLPELYNWGYSGSNLFDPWRMSVVDEFHYMTGAYFQTDFAREQRVGTTLHVYRRQWQLILQTMDDPDPSRYADLSKYADLIKEADLIFTNLWGLWGRCDLWKRSVYKDCVLETFQRFVREHLSDEAKQTQLVETEKEEAGLTLQAFELLTDQYWKPWLDYFSRHAAKRIEQTRDYVKSINPDARWTLGYALYPPYASVYKGAYFPLYMGYDVTREPIRSVGPLFLETYPYNARYCAQRGVYQLAAMKLVAPEQKLYVELYSASAGSPGDGALLFAHPPYSVHYVPSLYIRKQLFEFAFAAVWFDKDGFSYWQDRGFHVCNTWRREDFAELLRTWGVIHRTPPVKPLRTTAFGFSLDICRRHPDYYEPQKPGTYWGDMYNTAEECSAYTYEQAWLDGQSAGFLLDMDAVGKLDPADADTLVLPPLTGVSKEMLGAIRTKHEQGVNLLGFEDVTGLEDLFGVAPLPETLAVNVIQVNPDCAAKRPWRELAGFREECGHPLCRTRYKLDGGRSLLDGGDVDGKRVGPVLVNHQTKWGLTALFCVPPTVVNRADQKERVQYGQECLSHLMNRATRLILRLLGQPLVETTAGKLIAFQDAGGSVHVIVMEDAWPETPHGIEPRVTAHLPNIRREAISCDHPFSILEVTPDQAAIRLSLEPHESAMITFEGGNFLADPR